MSPPRQLGVCTQTSRRWLAEGLLPAEQASGRGAFNRADRVFALDDFHTSSPNVAGLSLAEVMRQRTVSGRWLATSVSATRARRDGRAERLLVSQPS